MKKNLLICKCSFLILVLQLLFSSCEWALSLRIDEQARIKTFQDSPEETLKPTIWDVGNTTISNEDRYDLFQKHIQSLGGGYVGVGSIQNFTFAAWARSEWIWLMDFTRIVVAANKIHIAFLKEAPSPEEFRRLWSKKAKKHAYRIIKNEFNQEDRRFIRKTWRVARPLLKKRMKLLDKFTQKRNYTTWLQDRQDYEYLRKLALAGRIRALHGDLTKNISLKGIAEVAKNMRVNIRVAYFSNAEEYFKYQKKDSGLRVGYPKAFRENWLAMPFDEKSTVIRTISFLKSVYKWPEGSEHSTDRGFHYNIMPGKLFQKWLNKEGHVSVITIVKTSENFGDQGYSVVRE